MRRFLALILAALMLATAVSADTGNVIYDGITQDFVFSGNDQHLTDLFPNFKDVMPGDHLEQTITVKNDSSNKVKVEIYIRSLGAQEGSEEFLSQLKLKVQHSEENTMAYMFDAYANDPAQMGDWVCLGMLYSGGQVNLDVTLDVPVEMGNEFQNAVGYLQWEFKVIEYPVEPTDPEPPKTGDEMHFLLPAGLMVVSVVSIWWLIVLMRRKKDEADEG